MPERPEVDRLDNSCSVIRKTPWGDATMTTLQEVFQEPSPVAMVTGSGAPRLGRSIATHLATLGCRIALHANTSVEEAEKSAAEIAQAQTVATMVVQGSLEEPTVADRLVSQVHDQFGRLDILVNSAAIWKPSGLEQVTAEEALRYLKINALGSFLVARAAGLVMVDQPAGGSIINLGDWATHRPYLDHAAYFPSKGAVEAMTRSLAVELAHRNPKVRVNCIQPGTVLLGDDISEDDASLVASCALTGRVGTPAHIAKTVQFLCENDFVTGVCLPVDGGRSIYAPDGFQTRRIS